MTSTLHSAPPPAAAQAPPPSRRAQARLERGERVDPGWTRPAFWVLLVGTAVLYLWGLGASGDANSYYAAAVQAGTKSWKALLFGSLDAGNSITVDKPPAALWVMGLSGRIFGFNAWSMLVPQALEGVAAVALLHGTVRRSAGRVAALVAGAALALTPAAALIFRFNNPDALLVLLMVAGAWCLTRALDGARTRWLVLAGVALGFAFLAKMGQAFLVLPAFSLVYLIAAPTSLWRRVRQLLAAGLALVVSAGWYVALVELWPASSRPYIGGSTDNSLLQLALGYNGLGRLTGGSGNSSGMGGGMGGSSAATGTSFGGATGLARLFSNEFGNEISWLLPAALVALVAGLWLTRWAPRTDRVRASLLLWGLWLVVTGLVLSYMSGTVHPYYTVALAPAIAALVAVGGREAWQARERLSGRLSLAAIAAAAGGWSFVVLERNSSWYPSLRWSLLALTVVAVCALLVPGRRLRRVAVVGVVAALVGGLGGTSAYALATAATTHSGSVPTVGPASAASSAGGMGGFGGPGGSGDFGGSGDSGTEASPTGAPSGTSGSTSGSSSSASSSSGSSSSSASSVPSFTPPSGASGMTGGPGGSSGSTSKALTTKLKATTSRWSAATVGAQTAAELELASDTSVMAIGGWSGSDASITLAQFKAYVAAGEIHYFIAGGGMGGGMGGQSDSSSVSSKITAWVTAHYTATTVGGQTVYDLTAAAS